MVNHNWAKFVRVSLSKAKELGNAAKTQTGAGVALVAAHPVAAAFTVVVIVGVGLAIYYYRAHDVKYPDDDDDPKGGSGYFYDPETKSVTDSPTTDSNIRKRQVAQKASSTTKRNLPETYDDTKNRLSDSNELYIETSNNLNTEDDKFLSDTGMSGDKKVEEFLRNISEAHFRPRGSDVESVESYDANELHIVENLDENSSSSSSSSISSAWSDISLDELTTSNNSIGSYSSVGTALSGDYDMCQACDEDNRNPVNTHNEPCQHRYVCDDCAKRIFKLFKRCKVCRARIEAIVLD